MSGLAGVTILLTRPRERAQRLADHLTWLGARVVALPLIAIEPVSTARLEQRRVDLVLFTSVNAVVYGHRLLPGAAQVAAIGAETAAALRERGVPADVVNDGVTGLDLVQALPDLKGRHVLLPRGDRADRALPDALRAAGASVEEIIVYRTINRQPTLEELATARAGTDIAVFYSPSAVQVYARLNLAATAHVCVGPTTAEAARAAGLNHIHTAVRPTDESMVEAVVRTALEKVTHAL